MADRSSVAGSESAPMNGRDLAVRILEHPESGVAGFLRILVAAKIKITIDRMVPILWLLASIQQAIDAHINLPTLISC